MYEIYMKHSGTRWQFAVKFDERIYGYKGQYKGTNSASMIYAATEALRTLPDGVSATVYSDFDYLVLGASKWIYWWINNGWRTHPSYAEHDVRNQQEWRSLIAEIVIKELDATWERKPLSKSNFIFHQAKLQRNLVTSKAIIGDRDIEAEFVNRSPDLRETGEMDIDLDKLAREWGYRNWDDFDNANDSSD